MVMCFIPIVCTNCLNSLEVKAGPLSDTMSSGSPCVAKVVRSFDMVAAEDVDGTICGSIHFKWASTMTSIVSPSISPA